MSSRADGESGPTRHFLAPSGSGTRSRSTLTWPSPQTVDTAWACACPDLQLCFHSSDPFIGVFDLGAPGAAAHRRPPRSARVAVAAAVGHDPGAMPAALPAGELIDVAVRGAKVAPPAAALIHLPTQQLHPGCLQLPHGGAEILDHKANHRTGGEVLVVLVAGAEYLEGASLGELEGGEVRGLLAGGQLQDRLEEGHHGRVLACPGACPPNALDPHPCLSSAQVLGGAILPPRRRRS